MAAEVDQVILDTHTEDTATEEDGDLSQEEVDEVTPRMGLAVLDSPVPLAARADQEAQEELEEDTVAAEVDKVILDNHTEDKEMAEDGDSSQEEVDEVTPQTDQEVQEDLEEEAAAVEDQATLRALELRQT